MMNKEKLDLGSKQRVKYLGMLIYTMEEEVFLEDSFIIKFKVMLMCFLNLSYPPARFRQ